MNRKKVAIKACAVLLVIVLLGVSYKLAGLVSTVIYAGVFLTTSLGIPAFIAFVGPTMPGFFRDIFGTLNWILGMIALDVGILVQNDETNEYEMWPGRVEGRNVEVYFNGEWRQIGNREYLDRLGWRPFGMTWYKTKKSVKAHREDAKALKTAPERASVKAEPRTDASDDEWLLYGPSVFERLQNAAGIGMITESEEQQRKKEADKSGSSTAGKLAGSVIGLILGVGTGIMMTGMQVF